MYKLLLKVIMCEKYIRKVVHNMNIDDYKREIKKMVDEILSLNYIVQIYTVTVRLYRRFKRGE
nr:MAG TPA: hypothetical protein [Caudoviricetes sp.]